MQKKQFKQGTKFYLFIVLGIVWICILAGLMVLQNIPPEIKDDPTLKTLAWIQRDINNQEPITPLPNPSGLDSDKIALGFKLFKDPILSHDNSIACTDCHDLQHGGADHVKFSFGINHAVGRRNTPTVFNSGFNYRQFWDGRASTLEEQIDGPILNPLEMGSSWEEMLIKLNASKYYAEQFQRIYGSKKVTADNVRDAIATFERSLVMTNSRFDKWLKGDSNALSTREKEGYRLFKSYGCSSCHQGVNIGGNMFERIGVFRDYYEEKSENVSDMGRFEITGLEDSRHEFKVPSLRNVTLTKPYFHDGSVETLHDAIDIMAIHQLGVKLSNSEIETIEDFLNSLVGEMPEVLK
ncbi:MAG: cytochrome-c peroxidase [Methylococcales bacterium]